MGAMFNPNRERVSLAAAIFVAGAGVGRAVALRTRELVTA